MRRIPIDYKNIGVVSRKKHLSNATKPFQCICKMAAHKVILESNLFYLKAWEQLKYVSTLKIIMDSLGLKFIQSLCCTR